MSGVLDSLGAMEGGGGGKEGQVELQLRVVGP